MLGVAESVVKPEGKMKNACGLISIIALLINGGLIVYFGFQNDPSLIRLWPPFESHRALTGFGLAIVGLTCGIYSAIGRSRSKLWLLPGTLNLLLVTAEYVVMGGVGS